ncbi:MAG: hypothetical protein QHC90_22595 [Shinella sp.]|nr:hypothetical protein [Shinella sp.]
MSTRPHQKRKPSRQNSAAVSAETASEERKAAASEELSAIVRKLSELAEAARRLSREPVKPVPVPAAERMRDGPYPAAKLGKTAQKQELRATGH